MTRAPAPTPAEQIAFLGNIERLLSEGQFVATYKYALLIAIADLAVQLGSDDGSELQLPLRAIAEQFIELYWRDHQGRAHRQHHRRRARDPQCCRLGLFPCRPIECRRLG
jgi:hypothetical protein